jgi:hypothetical protein
VKDDVEERPTALDEVGEIGFFGDVFVVDAGQDTVLVPPMV